MTNTLAQKLEKILDQTASYDTASATQISSEYVPKFTVLEANKLIAESLTYLEAGKPDMISLLQTIEKLAKVIQDASYDHSVLKNLITENKLLAEECFQYRRGNGQT